MCLLIFISYYINKIGYTYRKNYSKKALKLYMLTFFSHKSFLSDMCIASNYKNNLGNISYTIQIQWVKTHLRVLNNAFFPKVLYHWYYSHTIKVLRLVQQFVTFSSAIQMCVKIE